MPSTPSLRPLITALLLLPLTSFILVPSAEAQGPLTVMTWNISAQGPSGNWDEWGDEMIAYLLASDASIIALSEAPDAVADMLADPGLSARYDFFETASDQPILIDKGLSLTVVASGPGVGGCSQGTFATIELPSGLSFDLHNNHFCNSPEAQNFLDAEDLVLATDPAGTNRMIVALGDLNTSATFNPDTLTYLLDSGFIDTWEYTGNPDPKRDVMWILVNGALADRALITNSSEDNSCGDGSCSGHRAFFVDIELMPPVFSDGFEDGTTDSWSATVAR